MVVRQKNPVNLITLLIFILLNVTGLFTDRITEATGLSKYGFFIILYIVCFGIPLAALAIINRKEIRVRSYLKLKNFKLRYLPVSVSAGLAASLFAILLNTAIYALFKIEPSGDVATAIGSVEFDGLFSVLFAVVLMPAVFEELYFRGAYCSQYSEYPRIEVILAAAISFTVLHGSLDNIVAPFICSVVYSFLVYFTGSIWSAIIAHTVNNLLAVGAAYYADVISNSELKWAIFVTFLLVFFISLYFTLRFFEKHYLKSKKRRRGMTVKESKRSKNRQTPFTKSFFILIALFIVKVILTLTGFWK